MTNQGRDLAIASGELRSRRAGRLVRLGSVATAALAAALAASRAEAHGAAAQDGFVPLAKVAHVASVEQLSNGTVRVTLDNGKQLVLSADQIAVTPDGIFVSPDAVAEIAAGAAGGGGLSTGVILGTLGGLGSGGLILGLTGDSVPPNAGPMINSAATVSVAENQTGTGLSVQATDPEGDAVTYSISGGADAARFAINSSTGALSFITPPDFEAPADTNHDNVYEVTVQASDPTHSVTQAVTVTVTNVNDVAPVITSAAAKSIAENGTAVQTVTATDVDGGTIQFAIAGGADAARFQIDPATGALAFIAAPDFETPADADRNNVYEVVVRASDGTNASTQTILVTITNVNDAVPVFTSNASASVPENLTGTALTVTASDAEGDAIRFAITGGADAALFRLDAATGALAFVTPPDFEAPGDADHNRVYQVVVQASDGVNAATQAVSITVTNVNDVAPSITSPSSVSVAEGTRAVLAVAASDPEGDALGYAIVGGADAARFAIDAGTGALSFISAPDFEAPADSGQDNGYQVVIQVSDGVHLVTQTVTVAVTNINDVAPVIGSAAAVTVSENSLATGLTVTASDAEGDAVRFAVSGGADAGRFAIDAVTGALSFIAPPDYEAPADADHDNRYQVTIQASDGVNSVSQAIIVTVSNANDVAPMITSAAVVSTPENQLATGLVFAATDIDGDAIQYSIAGGADAARFTLDPVTGALRFAAAPDFEVPADSNHDNRYDVTLQASDGVHAVTQNVSVTVTDVVETPPSIMAALAHDNGRSATDGLTNDAGIAGTVGAPSSMTSLTLRVDGGSAIDITDLVGANGSFAATEQQIEAKLGAQLTGGAHDFVLVRTDRAGTTLSQTLHLTLDQDAPTAGTAGLSRSSDTGTVGDGITSAARVALVGSAGEADLDVSASGHRAITDGHGDFTLSDIAIPVGPSHVEVIFSDAAGNATAISLPLTRIAGDGSPDQVLFWNDIAQQAVARSAAPPTYASRALAMQSIAVYDAVSAIDGSTPFWISLPAGAQAGVDAAIAYASHDVLLHLFPSQRAFLDAALAQVAGRLGTGATLTQGQALGEDIAEGIIALREHDGYDAFVTFDGGDAPGEWVPTGPAYMLAEAPQWATLEAFALASNDQFRADGPPALDSAEYAAAFNEIKALGSATNSTRTADQTAIANFWKDGAGTNTPPGHWNDVAAAAAIAAGGGVAANARMFAMLNVGLADAAIAAWDTKYNFISWRPETAIQRADQDGNAATTADPNWAPFIISPAHPDYVSGHSTFSGAGAEILTYLFGENFSFTVGSEGVPGATRTFHNFWEAAQEAGRSRVYGGIHFEFSNQDGQALGKSVGDWVIGAFSQTSDTAPPRVTFGPASGLSVNGAFDLTGSVLDNLSGVAGLFYRIDGGATAALTFDATGHFTLPVAVAGDHSFDGAHTIDMFGVDAAGNIGMPRQFTFSADTRAPVISVTSFAESAALASGARLSGSLDIGGSAIVALGYTVDGGVVRPLSFNATTGAFDAPLDLAALAIGGHQVVLHASDAAGNAGTKTLGFTTATVSPFTIASVSIADHASDVGLTQRPQVYFSKAVDPATVTTSSFYVTDAAGNKLPATILVAADGKSAYLFHDRPMPGAQTLKLHIDGAIVKAADGTALDGDANGMPGGAWLSTFTTVNDTPVAGTTLSGFVVGPGADLLPMTRDDYRPGPDGISHTPDDLFLERIAGVKVYILGHEDQAVYTDATGHFTLTNVPAGNVKLEIDGRTATNAPAGFYFPDMVMDLNIRPGVANTVMGTMGSAEQQLNNLDRGEVYLPRVDKAVLIDIDDSAATEVTAKGNAYTGLTAEERDQLKLVVTPGSVIGPDGQPLADAQVGISTVPAELVRDMLPDGLLQHTFDITIQAPGAAIFAEPLQMTFPNVFNAAPGTKLNFLSFDHTTGRLVIEGTATVSADGLTVVTDPDSGISKPGWHGLTPPGTKAEPSPNPEPPEPPTCHDTADALADNYEAKKGTAAAAYAHQVACIAEHTCEASDTWGQGWIQDVFNKIGRDAVAGVNQYAPNTAATKYPDLLVVVTIDGVDYGLSLSTIGAYFDGNSHFKHELEPVFKKNAAHLLDDLDHNGRIDHEDFLQNAVTPCFDEVAAAGELSYAAAYLAPRKVIHDARQLREKILEDYHRSHPNDDRVSPDISVVGKADEATSTTSEIESLGQFTVGSSSGKLLKVGENINLSIKIDGRELSSADGVKFYILGGAQNATLDGNVLKIPESILATAGLTGSLAIFAEYDGKFGFGEFEFYDDDADGDGVVDSFETAHGLNPLISNRGQDSDGDGLEDTYEIVTGTNPNSKDTDGDGSDDKSEFLSGTLGYVKDEINPISELGFFWKITDLSNGQIVSGYVAPGGSYNSIFLRNDTDYRLENASADGLLYGRSDFRSAASGSITTLPGIVMIDVSGATDSEEDGLSSWVEGVIGTSDRLADTDHDGLTDLFEIQNGLNPLGNFPTAQGVVNTLDLKGETRAIDTVVDADGRKLAIVATGSHGVAIVDIGAPLAPKILAQLDLPGYASDIAVDAPTRIAVVATGAGGLQFVDIAAPGDPAILFTIAGDFDHVVLVDGIVFADSGTRVQSFDLATGESLQSLSIAGDGDIVALAQAGAMIYALTSGGTLQVIEVDNGLMITRGSTDLGNNGFWPNFGSASMFVGDGVLYIPVSDGDVQGGYATVNISDPAHLALISGPDNRAITGGEIALNGSGTGIVVGHLSGQFAVNAIDVVNTANPQNTGTIVTRFTLQAAPTAVAIGAGFAYVGDVTGGFHVVNYSGFDAKGVAPTATITALPHDIDPNTAGIQVQEGQTIALGAAVTDDVQVRQLDVLVNGRVISTDISFPWDLRVDLPSIAANGSDLVTLQVRATDMGGNVGLSEAVTVHLVPDTVPPALVASNIADGQLIGISFRTFSFTFSEALDPAGVTAENFRLIDDAGHTITPSLVQLRDAGRTVKVSFDPLDQGDYHFEVDQAAIRDRAGNAAGTDVIERGFTVSTFSIEWINPNGGNWNDPANWSEGRVPNASDDVAIILPSTVTITIPGKVEVGTLISNAHLAIGFDGELALHGGDLSDVDIKGGLNLLGAVSVETITLDREYRWYEDNFGIYGPGNLTITGEFDWHAGGMSGAGRTLLADGARIEITSISPPGGSGAYLGRALDIAGDVVATGALTMSTGWIDAGGHYSRSPGTLTVLDGGRYELRGEPADVGDPYNVGGVFRIAPGGTAVKTGGGTSSFSNVTLDGSIDVIDGEISIEYGSTYVLGDGDVAGRIVINGGTLIVAGDASVGDLRFLAGELKGAGDLNVTGTLDWRGGRMDGDGHTIIADGATGHFGRPADPDSPSAYNYLALARPLDVAGEVELHAGRLDMGPDFNAIGRVSVLSGGRFALDGAFADLTSTYGVPFGLNVAADGSLVKTGGGTSTIYRSDIGGKLTVIEGTIDLQGGDVGYAVPAGMNMDGLVLGGGRIVLPAGAVLGRLIVTGGTVEIPAGASIGELILRGGTLEVTGDASIGTLTFSNGTIQGAGDLTVHDAMNWTGGAMTGAGDTILAAGGEALFGLHENPDQPGARGYLYMGRHLELAGNATLESMQLYVGYQTAASIRVAPGGSLDLKGAFADLYEGAQQSSLTVAPGGTLIKSGGGTSTTYGVDINGAFSTIDGTLELQGAAYTLPDGAVIDRLIVNSGSTLTLAGTATIHELIVLGHVTLGGTATIGRLQLSSGEITGAGDLIVTDHLYWTNGNLSGSGKVVIPDGADGTIGVHASGDDFNVASTVFLGRVLEVGGDIALERAQLYLGSYDYIAGVYRPAVISVLAGGSFDMHGGFADIYPNSSNENPINIAAGGSFTKTGGGTSSIFGAKITGTIQTQDGVVVIAANTTYTLPAGATADHIVLDGGTLIVAGSASVADLDFRNGTIDGAGNLTITHDLRWTGGLMTGAGKTILAADADASLGGGHDADNPNSTKTLVLGRTFDVLGDATFERGALYLGTSEYSEATGIRYFDGVVSVKAGGALHLAGAYADIYENNPTSNNRIEIAAGGTLLKDGGGISTIQNGVDFSNLGTVTAVEGRLETVAGTFGTLAPVAPPAAVGEVVDPGETLTLAAGTHLAELTVSGGTLVLAGNVTIDHLVMLSGEVKGGGNLTVSARFDWVNGAMTGAGKTVIATGAALVTGYAVDTDNPHLRGSVQLGRLLEVAGHASVEAVQFVVGSVQYDDNFFEERYEKGMLSILSGGSFELKGPYADVYGQPRTGANDVLFDDSWIRIATGGSFIKSGGGTSSIGAVDIEGVVTVADGVISIDQRGVYVLHAGDTIDRLIVNGGTLYVEAGATVRDLTLISGAVDGPGALTLTGKLDWRGGAMMGDGKTVLADGATALIGVAANPDEPYIHTSPVLGRLFEVAGDARVESAVLTLGFYGTDAALGRFVSSAGRVAVLDGGSMDLAGPFAELGGNSGSGNPALANRIDVAAGGALIKSGGGITRVDNIAMGGSFSAIDGTITIGNGTVYTLKAGDLATGIVLAGGTLIVDGAATIPSLRIQYGTLDLRTDVSIGDLQFHGGTVIGDGDLTVSHAMFWTEGSMSGAGKLTVASGADAVFGYESNADNPNVPFSVQLGRVLDVAGDVLVRRGTVYLETQDYDSVHSVAVYREGVVDVLAGGRFELAGPGVTISQGQYRGNGRIEVDPAGHFVKSGDGISAISGVVVDGAIETIGGEMRFENDTTYTLRAGTSMAKLTLTYGARLIVEDHVTIGELVLTGGTLELKGDASIGILQVTGGDVIGAGDLTITGNLTVRTAAMSGAGKIIIADGAHALFGSLIDPDNPGVQQTSYMGRTLEISGDLTIEQAALYLGYTYYDPNTNQSVRSDGRILVKADGELRLDGPYSDIYDFYGNGGSIRNEGVIIKNDGGTSTIGRSIAFASPGEIRIVEGVIDAPQVTPTSASVHDMATLFALDGLAGPILDAAWEAHPSSFDAAQGETTDKDGRDRYGVLASIDGNAPMSQDLASGSLAHSEPLSIDLRLGDDLLAGSDGSADGLHRYSDMAPIADDADARQASGIAREALSTPALAANHDDIGIGEDSAHRFNDPAPVLDTDVVAQDSGAAQESLSALRPNADPIAIVSPPSTGVPQLSDETLLPEVVPLPAIANEGGKVAALPGQMDHGPASVAIASVLADVADAASDVVPHDMPLPAANGGRVAALPDPWGHGPAYVSIASMLAGGEDDAQAGEHVLVDESTPLTDAAMQGGFAAEDMPWKPIAA